MSNYSDYLVNYYNDLETVLVDGGHITIGNKTDTPTISGVSNSWISSEVIGTITNYDSDNSYWISSSGTSTISGSNITWRLPNVSGTYTANIYTVEESYILSDPGQWEMEILSIPGWNGDVVYVGSTRTYTTINAGIAAANSGDMILIDPGTYVEHVNINKHVHLRGNTEDLDSNTIYIHHAGTAGLYAPVYVDVDSGTSFYNDEKVMYIEGIKITPDSAWHANILLYHVQTDLNLIINKCRFDYGSTTRGISDWRNSTSGALLEIKYCYVARSGGYSHFYEMDDPFSLTKVELNSTYNCSGCSATPSPSDYVITPTSGYGYDYGDYILPAL